MIQAGIYQDWSRFLCAFCSANCGVNISNEHRHRLTQQCFWQVLLFCLILTDDKNADRFAFSYKNVKFIEKQP